MRFARQTLIAVLLAGLVAAFWCRCPCSVRRKLRRRLAAASSSAAEAPPQPQLDKWNDAHSIPRSNQPAFNWLKLLSLFLLVLIWVKSADWINRDSQIFDQGYGMWNPMIFFPVLVCFLLFAFPCLDRISAFHRRRRSRCLLCYLATFIPYVVMRNKSVALHQRVFTADWFRYEFATMLNKVGIKMEARAEGRVRKGRECRPDGHRWAGRAGETGQSAHRPAVARLFAGQGADCRHGRSASGSRDARLHAAIGRLAAIDRRRLAQRQGERPRIGRRDAGRDENAGESGHERAAQEAGREVWREVQRPQVRLPRLHSQGVKTASASCSTCWAASERRSSTTKTWECGRSSPSNGQS